MSSYNERLPGSNPEAPHGIEQRELDQTVTCEQFTKRAKIGMGFDQLSEMEYGIIAGSNPTAPANGSAFHVVSNPNNALRFDLYPGRAMTRSGFLIEIETLLQELSVESAVTGTTNVVFLAYQTRETTDPNKLAVTRAHTVAGIEFEVVDAETLVQVATLDRYLDAGEFSDDDKLHHVVLALVKVTEDGAGSKSFIIDHSQTSYSWVRPWYSTVDTRHRAKVGSGKVTDNNPHGIGLSDIGQGDMTLLQALIRTGTIISKDYDVDRMAGFLCTERVTQARLRIDDASGTITGCPNAWYTYLLDVPIHLGRTLDVSDPLDPSREPPDYYDYSPWLIKGTNILVFHPDEVIGAQDIDVNYMCAAGSMRTDSVPDILLVNQLDSTREMCITDGQAVTEFLSNTIDLRDYRPHPMVIRAFVKGDGSFVTLPQVGQCNKTLAGISGSVQADIDLLGPSRLWVSLTNTLSPPLAGMDVQIEVIGTDANGAIISETLKFDSDWRDFLAPSIPGAMRGISGAAPFYQKKPTSQIFYSFSHWNLSKNANTDPGASIAIFCAPDWRLSPGMRDLCCLGAVLWDGLTVPESSTMDFRGVRRNLVDLGERMVQAEMAGRVHLRYGIAGGTIQTPAAIPVQGAYPDAEILVEDFNHPRYHGLKQQRADDYAYLVDAANYSEAYDNVDMAYDRWGDGISSLAFGHISPNEARPHYISRALRFPIFGHVPAGAGYTGYMKIRLIRHYLEDQGHLGSSGGSENLANNANKIILFMVRFGSISLPADDWSPWYEFTTGADAAGRDLNTFWLQTGVPGSDFFTKLQFGVVGGGLRALALEFPEGVEDLPRDVEELTLFVHGKFADLQAAEAGGGNLTTEVVKSSTRITVDYIGPAFNSSAVNQFRIQNFGQTAWLSGVYLLVFRFDGNFLSAQEYDIVVTAHTEAAGAADGDRPIPKAVAIQKGQWSYFQTQGGDGRVAISLRTDSDQNTKALRDLVLENFCDFTVTIRVPL